VTHPNYDVTLFTDGACIGNPGPGGYGVILDQGGKRRELSGGFRRTTNNRMELMAAIVGLSELKQPGKVRLISDSTYLVNSMNLGWARQWRAKGYKKKKNPDLWERILNLVDRHSVEFIWVEGHAGHPENERCDRLSVQAAQRRGLPADEVYEREETPSQNLRLFK
jgi:ribonuclease HI